MEKIKDRFFERASSIGDELELKKLGVDYLGRNGEITILMGDIKKLSIDDKRFLNTLKKDIADKIADLERHFKEQKIKEDLKKDKIDTTIPHRRQEKGLIHPLTKTIKELENVFYAMGFSITKGFEIEDDWHNFTALNTPLSHPARQMQDTFFLKNAILRTQCTATDIREMERKKPPYKFVSLGKTYRVEMDATHSPMFSQVDLQYIDKGLSVANLKYVIMKFCKIFFEIDSLELRFRPSYFPFTTPSLEVDMSCTKDGGKIVKFGEGNDWCELGGSGFTHPNVIKNVGLDPNEWKGFAFGFGLERMAMLKYGIGDIRTMLDGDIRYLRQYGFGFHE
ncbi:MAG: phenylalanine--tRNA ligase subunit alpha [Rickettsiales bacterium]|jgi:phenylalanyl-tRNA synthetase alpha chain|nr:phenylalanine--tRNA ligase subunit alpha [Rickettsiales bacterium]